MHRISPECRSRSGRAWPCERQILLRAVACGAAARAGRLWHRDQRRRRPVCALPCTRRQRHEQFPAGTRMHPQLGARRYPTWQQASRWTPQVAADRSRQEQHLTRGPPSLKLSVRFRRRGQGKLAANAHLQRSIGYPPQNGGGTLDQLSPSRYIVSESGPSEEERPLLTEQLRIDRSDGTTRLPIEYEHSPRSQTCHTLGKCGLSYRVVHDIHPGTTGQPSGLALEILFGIEDDFMRTCCPCQCRLGRG